MVSKVYDDRRQTKKTMIAVLILFVAALIVYALAFGPIVASISNKAFLTILGSAVVIIILLTIIFAHE